MKKTLSIAILLIVASAMLFAATDINANDLKARVFKRDLVIDDNATILASASKSITIASLPEAIEYDGVTYTSSVKLSGAGNTSARAVRLTVTAGETVTLLASSSAASSARSLVITDEAGTEYGSLAAPAGNDPVAASTYTFTADGTYYLYSKSGGVNIYRLTVN